MFFYAVHLFSVFFCVYIYLQYIHYGHFQLYIWVLLVFSSVCLHEGVRTAFGLQWDFSVSNFRVVWALQVIMRDHTSSANVEELLRQSHMELQWIQRQLAMIAARNTHHHHLHTKNKVLRSLTVGLCYYYC